MTAPIGHTLTLIDIGGRRIEARVVYLQPGATWYPHQRIEVHIVCREWLADDWYPARYSTGNQIFGGMYRRAHVAPVEEHGYLFEGTFERAQSMLPPDKI